MVECKKLVLLTFVELENGQNYKGTPKKGGNMWYQNIVLILKQMQFDVEMAIKCMDIDGKLGAPRKLTYSKQNKDRVQEEDPAIDSNDNGRYDDETCDKVEKFIERGQEKLKRIRGLDYQMHPRARKVVILD